MNKKIGFTIFLIFMYVVILNISPLIFNKLKDNGSYSFDFYAHATGAKQLIEEKQIRFDEDNRLIWGTDKSLIYPPGFMIFLSEVSLLTGINVLHLPAILITLNWFIFLTLLFVTANLFFEKIVYSYLSLLFGLFFISGSHFLGFSYLVPPILGCFLIWSTIIILLKENITIKKKIIINTVLISILFLTHRPSIITWFIMLIGLSFSYVFLRSKHILINYLIPMGVSTIFALGISTILLFRKILSTVGLASFLYNGGFHISNFEIYFFIVLLNIIAFFLFFKINKYPVSKGNIIATNEGIKRNTVFLFIALSLLFFLLISSGFIMYLLKNLNLVFRGSPINWIFNIWDLLGARKFFYLKQIIYIFHLGLIPVLLYFPSLYITRKNKKLLPLFLLPLFTIFLTFFMNFFVTYSKPERVYIYIIPYLIVGSVITTKFLFENFGRVVKYSLGIIIILSLVITATVTITNLEPWPNEAEFSSLMWLKTNTNNEDAVLSQGYFAQPGKAFGINNRGLYSYRANSINHILKTKHPKEILFLDDLNNPRSSIVGMQTEVENNIDHYDQLYSNAKQVVFKKNA